MTNEEAISTIEIAKAECEWNAPLDYYIAFDMAIEALRKQIPQKAKAEYIAQGGVITCFETHVCPNCDRNLYDDEAGITVYYDYCPYCGKAIDWSEYE